MQLEEQDIPDSLAMKLPTIFGRELAHNLGLDLPRAQQRNNTTA